MHMAAAVGNQEWITKYGSSISSTSLSHILHRLVSLGLDINAMTKKGATPIKIARDNSDTEFVQFLKSLGAKEVDLFTYISIQEKKRKAFEEEKLKRLGGPTSGLNRVDPKINV